MTIRYAIRCSYGNDSVAMIRLLWEHGVREALVLYSETGWASPEWEERVKRGEQWVSSLGFTPVRIPSIGFENMVYNETKNGMWPTRQRKFCTRILKIEPAMRFLNAIDPHAHLLICVGVRRSESEARKDHPPFMPERDDGRHVWHPLIEFSEVDRDAMVAKTPMELLDHRSDECAICINSNRADFRRATEHSVAAIERMEQRVGRPMFDPKKFMGADGIREVKRWGDSERGQYKPEAQEPADCDDNWCGL